MPKTAKELASEIRSLTEIAVIRKRPTPGTFRRSQQQQGLVITQWHSRAQTMQPLTRDNYLRIMENMNSKVCCDPKKLRRPVQILKALAHPVRLYLVLELARGEKCVNELTGQSCCDISTVSRHLGQLRNAGIVEDDKRGLQVFYRLRAPCILDFISCLGNVPLGHTDLTDCEAADLLNDACRISASRLSRPSAKSRHGTNRKR